MSQLKTVLDILLRGIVKLIMALTQLSFSSSNDVAI